MRQTSRIGSSVEAHFQLEFSSCAGGCDPGFPLMRFLFSNHCKAHSFNLLTTANALIFLP